LVSLLYRRLPTMRLATEDRLFHEDSQEWF
jgi:hypothetical protein